MEIILREDVPHLGRRGEVVKVADGYARNYLIPKRLAYLVTPGIKKQVETETRAKKSRDIRERKQAEVALARLKDVPVIRFQRRAGETGTLFGSVGNADIGEELTKLGLEIDKRQVRLSEPIKRIGTHRVTVHLYKDLEAEVVIEVDPETEPA